MRFKWVEGPTRYVVKVQMPVPSQLPTAEELETLRRQLGPYDEADRERIVRGAFPSPPPEAS